MASNSPTTPRSPAHIPHHADLPPPLRSSMKYSRSQSNLKGSRNLSPTGTTEDLAINTATNPTSNSSNNNSGEVTGSGPGTGTGGDTVTSSGLTSLTSSASNSVIDGVSIALTDSRPGTSGGKSTATTIGSPGGSRPGTGVSSIASSPKLDPQHHSHHQSLDAHRSSFTKFANSTNSSATSPGGGGGTSPHPGYERKVGFDTMEITEPTTGGGTGVSYSFTLQAKSEGYIREKTSRCFLVATDLNEYSVEALNWLISNLAEDGDELVILRVIEPGSPPHAVWKSSQEEAREEAQKLMDSVMATNGDECLISIVVEFAIGSTQETIHRMVEIYRPDMLVVGTRGRSESIWKSAFMGSVSRYCVAKSPVPVVVVRPGRKVLKSLEKRRADPKRGAYSGLVGDSTSTLSLPWTPPAPMQRARTREVSDFSRPSKPNKGNNKDLKITRFKTVD